MQPECSVIIPTLNEEKFLPNLLEDLSQQTYTQFEVIVVDAGSYDKTKSVYLAFQKKLSLSFYDSARKNVSYQRNYGASRAASDLLIFLDADMRIDAHFIGNAMSETRGSSKSIFIPRVVSQVGTITNKVLFTFINVIIDLFLRTRWPFSSGGSMIIQKKSFTDLRGFDEHVFIAEDHEIVKRARLKKMRVSLLKKCYVQVSMRRLQNESLGSLFKKYFLASYLMVRHGRIDRKIFDYPMGGTEYQTHIKSEKNEQREV